MSKLKQLQDDFKEYLMHGTPEPMHTKVVDDNPMTAERRLNVYYEGYRLRLCEALQTDFPKLEILLGEEAFNQCCISYIDKYPSHHFSVRYFGQHFDWYLKETAPYLKYPFMAEMANFEWALMESLDAPNATIMTLEDLQKVPPQEWAELTFTVHPSVHLRQYHWDTPSLFKDIEQENPPREPVKLENSQDWLFWRKDLKSMYESLNPLALQIFNAVQSGATFGEIALSLCDEHDEAQVPQLCLSHIQYWIEQGILKK